MLTSRLIGKIIKGIISLDDNKEIVKGSLSDGYFVTKKGKTFEAYIFMAHDIPSNKKEIVDHYREGFFKLAKLLLSYDIKKINIVGNNSDKKMSAAVKTLSNEFPQLSKRTFEVLGFETLKDIANNIKHDDLRIESNELLLDILRNIVVRNIIESLEKKNGELKNTEKKLIRDRLITSAAHFAPEHLYSLVTTESRIFKSYKAYDLIIVKADIHGYSQAIEDFRGRDPEGLIRCMREWILNINAAAKCYGVILDKFMGDGILAYVGFPDISNKETAREASVAAILFVKSIYDLTAELLQKIDNIADVEDKERGVRIALAMGNKAAKVILSCTNLNGMGHLLAFGEKIVAADRLEKLAGMEYPVATKRAISFLTENLDGLDCIDFKYKNKATKTTDFKRLQSLLGDCYELHQARIGHRAIPLKAKNR